MGVQAAYVEFDFLHDFEELNGRVIVGPDRKCILRARSAKGALAAGTCHWGSPYSGAGEEGDRCLSFVCPCGCGERDFVVASLRNPNEGRRAWQWDGNLERPTLSPSIYRLGAACKWHGYLRAGVFESC